MSDTGSRVWRERQADGTDFWPSDDRRERSKGRAKLVIGGVVAAVVVVIAIVAVVLTMGGGGGSGSGHAGVGGTTLNPPTVYVPSPTSDGTKQLNQRGADKRPLNPGEVFTDKAKTVSAGKFTFNRVAQDLSNDCAGATWGEALQADLKKYGCTQVIRAAYLSADQQHSGQVIALNLESLEGAEQIVRDLTPGPGSGFIRPLPGPGINNFGAGFSAAYPSPFGHYVLIPWVQRNGGARPASMNELIDASLAVEPANDFAWQRLMLARG